MSTMKLRLQQYPSSEPGIKSRSGDGCSAHAAHGQVKRLPVVKSNVQATGHCVEVAADDRPWVRDAQRSCRRLGVLSCLAPFAAERAP